MRKGKQKKKANTALSENKKNIILLTAVQIYHQIDKKNQDALIELYDQRPEYYEISGTVIKEKDALTLGLFERAYAEKIVKVLMKVEDPYVQEVMHTLFLTEFYGIVKLLEHAFSNKTRLECLLESTEFHLKYVAIYYDLFIRDEDINAMGDMQKFFPDLPISSQDIVRGNQFFDSLMYSTYTGKSSSISGNVENNVFIASYKNNNLPLTRELLKEALNETLISPNHLFCLGVLPVATDGIEGYGLSGNAGAASISKKKPVTLAEDAKPTSRNGLPPRKQIVTKDEISQIVEMKKAQTTNAEVCSPAEIEYFETFSIMYKEELLAQTIMREADIKAFGYLIDNAKIMPQDIKRIINITCLRMEIHKGKGGALSDESIMKDKQAIQLLVSTVVSEMYNCVLIKERETIYRQKKLKEKKSDTKTRNSAIGNIIQKTEKENAELRLENKRLKESGDGALLSLKTENKVLLEAAVLAQKQNRQKDSEIEELKKQIAELKDYNDVLLNTINEEDCETETQNFSEEEFRKLLSGKRILVWGVRQRDADLLENYKELACFVTDKGQRNPDIKQVSTYDGIIIGTNHSSHSMYYDIKNTANAAGVPYVHMRKRDTNISKFYEAVKRLINGAESN